MAVDQASSEMEAFYQTLNENWMDALWRRPQQGDRPTEPVPPYQPAHWRWSQISQFIQRAGELVQPSMDAQRRVIQLTNPSLPSRSATHMVSGNVQMVLPGEIAPSHRHTSSAIRFIMKGEGAVTVVDGEPIPMHPGDLVLTPGWCFHGHISQADGPVLWMDSLDGPLVNDKLRISRYEQYPDELEPGTRPIGDSIFRYGGGNLRPSLLKARTKVSPQMVYPWDRTEPALHDLAKLDASPFDDVSFEYTNPTTGRSVLPTIGCFIQMLRPGIHTKAHRHSYCSMFHAFRGRGSTIVDGVQIDWEEGDFFALPPWCWHEHLNGSPSEEAVLFSTTDVPVLDSLNLLEEHEYPQGQQEVTAGFDARYRSGE